MIEQFENKIINADCLDILKKLPDKCIDLVLTDPPYGLNKKSKGGKSGKMNFNSIVDKGWDFTPDKEVFEEIGEAKEGLEKIQNYKDVIFWSFSRKDYQKTNWWPKTTNTNVSKKLTIRTANTVRKIVRM